MKRIFKFAIILVIALFVTSCQVKTSNLGDASQFQNGVSYFQDKNTGEVYAVVVIRKQGSMQQEGVGMAHIAKEDLTPKIIKQVKNYK